MSTELWRRLGRSVRSGWTALDGDWQSVAVGMVIVLSVGVFDLQIPW